MTINPHDIIFYMNDAEYVTKCHKRPGSIARQGY